MHSKRVVICLGVVCEWVVGDGGIGDQREGYGDWDGVERLVYILSNGKCFMIYCKFLQKNILYHLRPRIRM